MAEIARLGALQLGSDPAGTAATLATILGYRDAIAAARLDLLVLPEAVLGGYPKGSDFGVRLGYRTPRGARGVRTLLATGDHHGRPRSRGAVRPGPRLRHRAGRRRHRTRRRHALLRRASSSMQRAPSSVATAS